MRLKVLGRYRNDARDINVYPGDEIEVKDELGQWLMNDAPGCFEDPNAPASTEAPGPSDEARREADALLSEAQNVLSAAQQEAERIRSAARQGDEQRLFDLPPDGTTLPLDATPPVVTGPDSGVEIVHRADEEEQQVAAEEQATTTAEQPADVVFSPAPAFEEAVAAEEEDEETKALDAPPRDKAVKRAPRQK
jgi:hypothetical protein